MTTATTPYPLGRRLDAEHDERSRSFQAVASPVLRTVNHAHFGPVLDQQNLGSCTGNAAAHALATRPMYQHRYYTEADAIRFYSRATEVDNFAGYYKVGDPNSEDTGSDGLSVCKALKEFGEITSYTHAFSLAQALGALVLGPILIGIPFYDGMFRLNSGGFMVPSGSIAGGHEMCLVGINATGNYVTGINSWGPGWGLKGRFKMAFEHLGRLLSEDGDATVPVR